MLRVADIRQRTDYDCGPVCVRIVLAFHKLRWPLETVYALSTPHDGTDPRTLESFLRSTGLHVASGSLGIEYLRCATRQASPVIALTQHEGAGHYVTVKGVEKGVVHYQCPSLGPCKKKCDDFLADWLDVDRLGVQYRCWGIISHK